MLDDHNAHPENRPIAWTYHAESEVECPYRICPEIQTSLYLLNSQAREEVSYRTCVRIWIVDSKFQKQENDLPQIVRHNRNTATTL